MDNDTIQAIRQLLAEEREHTSRILAEEREHTSRMMDEKLQPILHELAEIKEDTTITRSATNSLIEWAENVGVLTQVKFPVQKANNG